VPAIKETLTDPEERLGADIVQRVRFQWKKGKEKIYIDI
jgi:hypothetical protein